MSELLLHYVKCKTPFMFYSYSIQSHSNPVYVQCKTTLLCIEPTTHYVSLSVNSLLRIQDVQANIPSPNSPPFFSSSFDTWDICSVAASSVYCRRWTELIFITPLDAVFYNYVIHQSKQ